MPASTLWSDTPAKSVKDKEVTNLIEILARALESLINKNKPRVSRSSIYHSEAVPRVSIRDYIYRHAQYLAFDEAHLIAVLVILDRYIERVPNNPVTERTCHRLLAPIFCLVHKFNSDSFYVLPYYAYLSGVPVDEMRNLEKQFFKDIDYRLYIDPKTYLTYKKTLVQFAQNYAYALSMSPQELEIEKEVEQDPLYHPPGNHDLPIELTPPASCAAASAGSHAFFSTPRTPPNSPQPVAALQPGV